MPGMDGYTLARKLRNLPQTANAVLIAITGYGQAEDRQRAEAAGFTHHLVKPVDTTPLLVLLARDTSSSLARRVDKRVARGQREFAVDNE